MPGAVQSQDLAIVGFGTVGSYFLVTGTTLLGTASSPCVVASLPNATQNMRRGYTQPASSLSAQSLSRLQPCRCMHGFSSVFRSGQAWPLLVCAGIFKNGAAAVSARHGVTQSLMQVGRNVLMALQCCNQKACAPESAGLAQLNLSVSTSGKATRAGFTRAHRACKRSEFCFARCSLVFRPWF